MTEESQHGDPKTLYPRLHCTHCDEWVYVTQAQYFKESSVFLECNCRGVWPNRDFPEVWERAS